jgi:hypothetical protein
MHLNLFVRGKYEQLKLWENLVSSQFWVFPRKNMQTGETEPTLVQGSLRYSILGAYEYIFPEYCLPEVLSFFGITNKDYTGAKSNETLKHKFKLGFLRKIFECQAIPKKAIKEASKIEPTIALGKRGVSSAQILGVSIHPIGIRKDIFGVMPKDPSGKDPYRQVDYYQELL